MLREQISARACWLRDAWGVGSAGGDPTVPAGVETARLVKAEVIYSSGARPRACEWRGDKQQIRRALAASFPLHPAAPTAQPVTDLPAAAAEGRRQLSGAAGGTARGPHYPRHGQSLFDPGASGTRMQWKGLASLEFIRTG